MNMKSTLSIGRSFLFLKQVQPNSVTNRLIPRRLLISSAETGGNTPWQPNKRINNHVRTAALVGLAASAYLTYLTFTKEDEINAALGTDWNTGLVGTVLEAAIGTPLVYIVLMPTVAL